MSNRPVHVALHVDIAAPADRVFTALTQWSQQGAWMVGTTVRVTKGDGTSVGSELSAFTGAGRIGFLDTMAITRWEPPHRVDVLHTGRVVRGTGTMEVLEISALSSRFIWSEDLTLPLGALGRLGWPVAKLPFLAGVASSLRSFGRLVEAGALPR